MVNLPQEFYNRMALFPDISAEEWEKEYQKPALRGIRLNLLKCSAERLTRAFPFHLEKAEFSPFSYYLPENAQGIGRLALHHAGAFYVQEPSAASAVTVLAPQPGERVLDLCAAPGGKSTQIAALLGGKGLLWSNEVVRSRASALLSNIERLGVRNAVISSCHPDVLCSALAGFFDRVLVDAPCSGEGMFRRDETAVREWSLQHVQACAQRQQAILYCAAQAVKENGVLVYSTCTFSPEENEGVIAEFLTRHPDFELEESGASFGRPAYPQLVPGNADMTKARRIFPMDGGEGHFVARLRRIAGGEDFPAPYEYKKEVKEGKALFEQLFCTQPYGVVEQFGEQLLLLPEGLPALSGLGVLRAGVMLGEKKKDRVEPAHGVFAAAKAEELRRRIDLPAESPQTAAFLRGEEIDGSQEPGFTGVSVAGVMLGFGKCSQGRLKNRYPKGLRNLK